VKSNKQSARSNGRLAKGKVIAGDLTTMPGDKYFMKSHKQIKDESQTQKKKKENHFPRGRKKRKSWAAIKYDHSTAPGLKH